MIRYLSCLFFPRRSRHSGMMERCPFRIVLNADIKDFVRHRTAVSEEWTYEEILSSWKEGDYRYYKTLEVLMSVHLFHLDSDDESTIEGSNEFCDDIVVELSNVSLSYVEKPKKIIFGVDDVVAWTATDFSGRTALSNETEDQSIACDKILGSPAGVVLSKITIADHKQFQEVSNGLRDNLYTAGNSRENDPRLFCGLYTMEKNHATLVKAVKGTWGCQCDAFLAFSTHLDLSIPAIYIPHLATESYHNIWQKVRSIWKYIYAYYLNEFDWFLLGGDDMYFVIDNLRAYLRSPEIREDKAGGEGVYLGRPFLFSNHSNSEESLWYNTGGAGYILDANAVKVLGENMERPHCLPNEASSYEDINVARCLWRSAGIAPFNTANELNRQRFHHYPPEYEYYYDSEPHEAVNLKEADWYRLSDPFLRRGLDCCSRQSVSFHYLSPDTIRRMHMFLHKCPRDVKDIYYSMNGDEYYDPSHPRLVAMLRKMS